MTRKKREPVIFEQVEILDAGSEGKAIARVNDMVVFVPFVVPGDIVDIRVGRKRKRYFEGSAIRFHHYSEKRVEPICTHFGICGGCKWQSMNYPDQLFYKQKQVADNLQRIGEFKDFRLLPILPSDKTTHYRNKLEFTFSNHRWLTKEELEKKNEEGGVREEELSSKNALGFHIPGMFDKVLDIETCYLQEEPSNSIRLALREYALSNKLSFYDVRKWTGFLRNVLVRNSTTGDIMVILVVRDDEPVLIFSILDHLQERFPEITSLYYVVNQKRNDSLSDQTCIHYKGEPVITEVMLPFKEGDPELQFRIGPTSFYQTNSLQAERLYRTIAEFAEFRGDEKVYDLYTGTGTIANYIARYVKQVTGIESIEAAIRDAELNSRINDIHNTSFFCGEAEKLLDASFIETNEKPDLIITDPPRAGMHEKVVKTILDMAPEKVIYVSCNPATQARDMALMNEAYNLVKCQPVDMFPHTHHVENVGLLKRRTCRIS
ncbi:MAG: 23S rRNA (uracil(1939)-C(5))-methyltransferase RlmD [Bacteroidia bacterium]|nr:23S rRNA (uracil(1939)-C(5))-methyltransferase RlmD [Bacteroidia bacterium]